MLANYSTLVCKRLAARNDGGKVCLVISIFIKCKAFVLLSQKEIVSGNFRPCFSVHDSNSFSPMIQCLQYDLLAGSRH